MAYCINCGAPLPEKAKFCNACGEKQEVIERKSPTADDKKTIPYFEESKDMFLPVSENIPVKPSKEDEEEDVEDDVEEYDIPVTETSETNSEDKTNTFIEENVENTEEDIEEDAEEMDVINKLSVSVEENENENDEDILHNQELEDVLTDPYWDDVRPEIDNEIYQIDRSIIFKGVASIAAVFVVVIYLIYMI